MTEHPIYLPENAKFWDFMKRTRTLFKAATISTVKGVKTGALMITVFGHFHNESGGKGGHYHQGETKPTAVKSSKIITGWLAQTGSTRPTQAPLWHVAAAYAQAKHTAHCAATYPST